MGVQPKIVVTDHRFGEIRYEEEILRPLAPKLVLGTCENEEQLIDLTQDADAVLNSAIPIGGNIIEQMKRCKVIAYYGTGTDSIDITAATERGIYVTNVSDYCSHEVAEHTMAFILALARKLLVFDPSVRGGKWREALPQPIRSLKEMKLGLYGYGKIAQAVAEKAAGMGLEILVCSRRQVRPTPRVKGVSFEKLVMESDFLSVHTALTPETRCRFGEREFHMMKPGAFFINTARGGLVDEEALAKALSEGWIAGAALDVLTLEPPEPSNRLLKLNSVILTPHVGWFSVDSNRRLRESAAREVLRVLSGQQPLSAVNFSSIDHSRDQVEEKPPEVADRAMVEISRRVVFADWAKRRRIRVAEFIVRYLEAMGVEKIFGVPGGSISPLYRAIDNSRIKDILTKHEAGAAFMADGYARVKGRLGVCMATTGPGATNLLTGVASAFSDSIPLLVLTGQVSTEYFGKGASQEASPEGADIVQMYKQVTRYSGLVFKASKAPELIRKALRHALYGRTGPAHLALPCDVLLEEIEDLPEFSRRPGPLPATFDREAIRAAATWLLRAKRPAMLLGHGCVLADACDEARRLAESLRVPVATTPKAKGAIPEDHLLSMGCLGFSGSPLAEWYLLSGEVDVLLAVGTSFNEWASRGWKKELAPTHALLHVDIDPHEVGKNYPVTVLLCGNAKTVLTELFFEIQRQRNWLEPHSNGRFEELTEARARVGMVRDPGAMESNAVPLKPQRLMADLRASLPPEAMVFVDGGANRAWATHYFQALSPRTFFSATGMASMGYGVAAAIGAKFAAPERIVVAIVGDGGFLMNGMEVATAVAHGKQVIWVVLNDGQLGMIYHGRRMLGYPTISSRYPKCDLAKVAEGLGARGIHIREPGEINPKLIRDIVEAGYPTVLDVQVDPEEAPPIGARVSSLKHGFAEAPVEVMQHVKA